MYIIFLKKKTSEVGKLKENESPTFFFCYNKMQTFFSFVLFFGLVLLLLATFNRLAFFVLRIYPGSRFIIQQFKFSCSFLYSRVNNIRCFQSIIVCILKKKKKEKNTSNFFLIVVFTFEVFNISQPLS
jgi:hypothetical protein